MKKLTALVAVALVGATASAEAQTWAAVGTPNNVSAGQQYWDNTSNDGTHCNVGYVLEGVAGTSGNSCSNQRPSGWLPYTGTTPTTYLQATGGGYDPFSMPAGTYEFSLLPGTSSTGGDIAAANQDWGYVDLTTLALTSFNGGLPGVPVDIADPWAFYIVMTNGNYAYSNSANQFALFGFGPTGSFTGFDTGSNYILGIEDIYTGSNGGSDKDYQDELMQFTYDGTGTTTETPEPGTMTLLATGLAGMAAAARRRRKSA